MVAASVLTAVVLASPGSPSMQDVPVAEQPDQHPVDEFPLPDHDLFDLRPDPADDDDLFFDLLRDFLNIHELPPQ